MNARLRSVLLPVLSLLLLAPAGASATAHRVVEDFASTRYRDALHTTAAWDTVARELRLPAHVMSCAGSYNTPGNARGIAVAGDRAYVCDYTAGLEILDIRDPANPILLGSYDTPGSAKDVAVAGNYAFVADYATGLVVLNVSNPASPTLAGSYNTPGSARAVALAGDVAYVADYSSGVIAINIANPASPTLLGSYDTPGNALDVKVAGDRLYVADGSNGVVVLNIATPASPTLVGGYDTPGSATAVAVAGDRGYVADGGTGLVVLDITNPAAPTLLGTCETPGSATDVALDGASAYVADGTDGLVRIDVRNPSAPALADSIGMTGTTYAVAVDGERAYVANDVWGVQVVEVSVPVTPASAGSFPTTYATEIAVDGTHAFVTAAYNGLLVLDISDPSAPALLGTCDTYYSGDVAIAGDYAYVTDHDSGLVVVNVADPATPVRVSRYDTPGNAYGVAVDGDYAYVADQSAGVKVLNISNPASPSLAGSFATTGWAWNVAVDGNYAYVAEYTSGLRVLNITNPAAPTSIFLRALGADAYDVTCAGGYAYVACGTAGVKVVDIQNPALPVVVSTIPTTPGQCRGVKVRGNRAYLAAGTSGVVVADVTDPTSPVVLGSCPTPASAMGVDVSGDYAFLATYSTGSAVEVVRVQQRLLSGQAQGRSLSVNPLAGNIVRTRLATVQSGSVTWELSADDGANWQSAPADWTWNTMASVGEGLAWRSTHVLEDPGLNPTCTQVSLDWRYEFAVVDSVRDVPGDQGGQVRIHFTRSGYDFADEAAHPIAIYDVWRRVDDPALQQRLLAAHTAAPAAAAESGGLPVRSLGARSFVVADGPLRAAGFPVGTWEVMGSFAATQQDQYIFPTSTLADSGAAVPYAVFFVTAHTTTPSVWYAGPPDSGYSVDDLAPPPPSPFTAAYASGATHLHWGPSPAPDFRAFQLHRGATEDFVPADENLVVATSDTGHVDAGPPGSWYKLAATDVHGNRSPYAIVGPGGITAVPGTEQLLRLALEGPTPNPASGRTLAVRFTLPSAEPARIELLDVSGRLLDERQVGALGAGPHTLVLSSARLRPGVYLVRLTQGAQARVRRAVLLE